MGSTRLSRELRVQIRLLHVCVCAYFDACGGKIVARVELEAIVLFVGVVW